MAGTGCWPGADGDRKECVLQMPLVSVGCTLTCVLACPIPRAQWWPYGLVVPSALTSSSAEGESTTLSRSHQEKVVSASQLQERVR